MPFWRENVAQCQLTIHHSNAGKPMKGQWLIQLLTFLHAVCKPLTPYIPAPYHTHHTHSHRGASVRDQVQKCTKNGRVHNTSTALCTSGRAFMIRQQFMNIFLVFFGTKEQFYDHWAKYLQDPSSAAHFSATNKT